MYTIINSETKQYFSLINGGLFTDNVELAQRFDTEQDAMLCTEQHIDSTEGFKAFGMIDTQIINLK
jgi:hypothetical protein